MRTFVRTNLKIRIPQVRCVNSDGTMLGVIPTAQAQAMAREQGLDLVEIAPQADPPVCKIMDFGKYRYEESRKEREARRHQQSHAVKEVKFHPNVAEHDYSTKLEHIRDFLQKGHKVKLTLTYRGRENAHKERGFELMQRVIKDCADVAVVDMEPRMMGRAVNAMLGCKPHR